MHTMTAMPVSESKIRDLRVRVTLALLAMQVYDLFITYKVLSLGGAELNPVAKLLIGMGLIIPLKIGIAAFAVWKAQYGGKAKFEVSELNAYGMAWFATGIYALVCVLNTLTYFTYLGS